MPATLGMLLGTGAGAHPADMHGGRLVVTAGTLIANVGVAVHTSQQLGAQGEPIASAARTAFVDSMPSLLSLAVGLAFGASAVTFRQMSEQAAHSHGVCSGRSPRTSASARRAAV